MAGETEGGGQKGTVGVAFILAMSGGWPLWATATVGQPAAWPLAAGNDANRCPR